MRSKVGHEFFKLVKRISILASATNERGKSNVSLIIR